MTGQYETTNKDSILQFILSTNPSKGQHKWKDMVACYWTAVHRNNKSIFIQQLSAPLLYLSLSKHVVVQFPGNITQSVKLCAIPKGLQHHLNPQISFPH